MLTCTSHFGKTKVAHVGQLMDELPLRTTNIFERLPLHQICLTNLRGNCSVLAKDLGPAILHGPGAK